MPPSRRGRAAVEERVLTELRSIRANVTGVQGSLAATADGLLVAHDLPDAEPAQIAALMSSMFALAGRATMMTGRGQFRETVTRGSEGYLAVYAAGRNAIIAVIGTRTLNVGLLQYQARGVIERVAEYADEFGRWSAPGQPIPVEAGPASPRPAQRSPAQRSPAQRGGPADGGPAAVKDAGPAPLPVRRPASRRGS